MVTVDVDDTTMAPPGTRQEDDAGDPDNTAQQNTSWRDAAVYLGVGA